MINNIKITYMYVLFVVVFFKMLNGRPSECNNEKTAFPNHNEEVRNNNQRTNGPVNAHLISWPSKAQNKQNLENIW